ncbi:acyl-CoA dehydrogenase family protein [Pseudonocardia oceani]|uniref:Acyl-CoA dehydrogenase family protein n=3 Tax=Pseudonocardia oceani TaxID=2792013 RepID=A0ABS6U243_9PSEU|nr:acyl-CoA dehydrogenase family protein [Pseudonocardia oceani]MBW0112214.1 acyl-CoA dehydrogenase family protein [Pseudonocardia oceani]MBW0120546.1 acyl-CoA dehydrogenase family protein [Pseudonocardia oceani]MBW0126300.1 acyl-CoA dehydrogenase family protein [Pseudonocardia oceani]
MDLALSAEAAAYRDELRSWVEEHLPAQWRDVPVGTGDDAAYVAMRREWGRMLHRGGWLAPHWPVAHGGRGLGVDAQLAFLDVMVAAGAPEQMNTNGMGIFAPALMAFGTEAQQDRYLGPMLAHDDIWCQGFSEPGAGSDLARLATRAVPDGDRFVVSGQKVWTSYALFAQRCYLMVRVAGVPDGVTMVVLHMDRPGVTVRPLRNITGTSEFCEVFLDEVAVDADDVVGGIGDGWRVATYALARERSTGLAQRALQLSRELVLMNAQLHRDGHADDVLVEAFVRSRAVDSTVRRVLATTADGGEPGMLAPVAKVLWSEGHQAQLATLVEAAGREVTGAGGPWSDWLRALLFSRAETIYGGTSEIQRNLIAKSLGMPSDRG